MSFYPILRVKRRLDKRLHAGSPWLYSNEAELTNKVKTLQPGTLVQVQRNDGESYGVGYFNPHSLIAVRMLSRNPEVRIDADFFAERIRRALSIREALFDAPYYRLVNAEGDGLPGLTIDRFGETYVIQISTAGMEALKGEVLSAMEAVLNPETMLVRADMPARKLEGLDSYVAAAKGEAGRIKVIENGVSYVTDLSNGQKTGWYYDQRDARGFLARLSKGKSMLDAYSYCGGFALAAAKAGAREVAAIDSSAPALALAAVSAAENNLECNFIEADAMSALEDLALQGKSFDVVSADPPPFVKSRRDLESGARAYRKLAKLSAQVTAKNGLLLMSSCSYNITPERFLAECAGGINRAGRTARCIRAFGAASDHPIHPMLAESSYLKGFLFALD